MKDTNKPKKNVQILKEISNDSDEMKQKPKRVKGLRKEKKIALE